MKSCYRCGQAWAEATEPGFNNTCEKCGVALHCCNNCLHYRPRASIRCDLPDTERILDAMAGNRCTQFVFKPSLQAGAATAGVDLSSRTGSGDFGFSGHREVNREDSERAAREMWDKLFG